MSISGCGFGLSRARCSSPEAGCVCPNSTGRKRGPPGAVALPTFHMAASPQTPSPPAETNVPGPMGWCGRRGPSWAGWATPRAAGALPVPRERLRPDASPSGLQRPPSPTNREVVRGRCLPRATEGVAELGVAFGPQSPGLCSKAPSCRLLGPHLGLPHGSLLWLSPPGRTGGPQRQGTGVTVFGAGGSWSSKQAE